MKDTNIVSARTEGQILAGLVSHGFNVLIPFGVARYDFVIETDHGFKRIQCKTGRLRNGCVIFSPYSVVKRNGKTENLLYTNDIDYFGVFCQETSGRYFVPVHQIKGTSGSLRIDPPKNNQLQGIKWAKDYELYNIGQGLFDPLEHGSDLASLDGLFRY